MNRFDEIWCVGGAHLDMVGRAEMALAPGGSAPGRVTTGFGGVALNVARGLARAGARATLIGAVGDDAAGAALSRHLAAAGVADRLIAVAAPTGVYLALEDASGELSAAIADLSALETVAAQTLAQAVAARPAGAALLIDGNLTAPQIAACVAPPGLVAAIAVSAAKAARLIPALPRLDALFCNLDEARVLTGGAHSTTTEAAAALAALGPSTVMVTAGAAGATLRHAGAAAEARPATRGARATNGAGDAAAAAALAAIGRGADAGEALAAAMRAAAHIVRGET